MIKLKSLITEKTLYHGTIIDNVCSIKNYGLIPSVGEFVKDAYDLSGYEEDINGKATLVAVLLPALVLAVSHTETNVCGTYLYCWLSPYIYGLSPPKKHPVPPLTLLTNILIEDLGPICTSVPFILIVQPVLPPYTVL